MVQFSFNTLNHGVAWRLPPTLPAQIAAAAAAGYDAVGLDLPSILSHEAAGCPPARLRGYLDDAGIGCFEILPLAIGAADQDQNLADLLRVAPVLGARHVMAVLRVQPDTALVAWTQAAARGLADRGLAMSVEFVARSPVDSIATARDFLDAVGGDTASPGIVVDSWHFFAGPSTWADLVDLPAEQLGFVQFSDRAPAISDDVVAEYRNRRVLPGEGVDDLSRLADHLHDVKRDVTVSVEVLSASWRRRPVADFAAAALVSTRPYFAGAR